MCSTVGIPCLQAGEDVKASCCILVADPQGYRQLRQALTGPLGLQPITRAGAMPLVLLREVRADPYGIRTVKQMEGQAIKP